MGDIDVFDDDDDDDEDDAGDAPLCCKIFVALVFVFAAGDNVCPWLLLLGA